MTPDNWLRFKGRRVLLLQGPMGPFFGGLTTILQEAGAAEVRKINFNGGDWLFYRDGHAYRGTPAAWPAELEALIRAWRIDDIMLFGDCRPVHLPVHDVADRLRVTVWVFEEGYIRPNYVTLERHGVNDRSQLPRDPDYYRRSPPALPKVEHAVGQSFWHAALWSVLYALATALARPLFPHYRHHRSLGPGQILVWVRGGLRRVLYRWRERHLEAHLTGALTQRFFLVPLQTNTDAQVRHHSGFRSVQDFIETVVASFARHAAPGHRLVFKHHPLDRGYHDYTRLLADLAARHGLGDRLIYLHDQHLPTLLTHARGVVVINSTVGLSALHHGTPTKVTGRAIYDMPGLSFQGDLAAFWTRPETGAPDRRLYEAFRNHLIHRTQLNGNFYRHGLFPRSAPRPLHEPAIAADLVPAVRAPASTVAAAVTIALQTASAAPPRVEPQPPGPLQVRAPARTRGEPLETGRIAESPILAEVFRYEPSLRRDTIAVPETALEPDARHTAG